jgi:ribosomal protein S18 acetylase RimI-like enzyme
MKIEKIGLDAIDQLQKISKHTFYETFAAQNEEENMQQYLAEGFSKDKLTLELQNIDTEFYFASIDEQVVGYLKINFGQAQTELQGEKSLEIERIYVTKEYHGKNVGQLLYDKAIEVAKNKQMNFVWLGVWEENPRAINFYKKNGFVAFDKHTFKLGNDAQTDIMMKLQLK